MIEAQTNYPLSIFHKIDFFDSVLIEEFEANLLPLIFCTEFHVEIVHIFLILRTIRRCS